MSVPSSIVIFVFSPSIVKFGYSPMDIGIEPNHVKFVLSSLCVWVVWCMNVYSGDPRWDP